MDKVIEQLEPAIKKVDDYIAKYPSMTQYGTSQLAKTKAFEYFGRLADVRTLAQYPSNVEQMRMKTQRIKTCGCVVFHIFRCRDISSMIYSISY